MTEEQANINEILEELTAVNLSSEQVKEKKPDVVIDKDKDKAKTVLKPKENQFYKNAGEALLSDVQEIIEKTIEEASFMDKMKAKFRNVWEGIKDKVSDTIGNVVSFFDFTDKKHFTYNMIELFLTVTLAIEGYFILFNTSFGNRLGDFFSGLRGIIGNGVSWVTDKVLDIFFPKNPEQKENIKKMGVWEQLKSIYKSVKDKAKKFYQALVAYKEVLGEIYDQLFVKHDIPFVSLAFKFIGQLFWDVWKHSLIYFWSTIEYYGLDSLKEILSPPTDEQALKEAEKRYNKKQKPTVPSAAPVEELFASGQSEEARKSYFNSLGSTKDQDKVVVETVSRLVLGERPDDVNDTSTDEEIDWYAIEQSYLLAQYHEKMSKIKDNFSTHGGTFFTLKSLGRTLQGEEEKRYEELQQFFEDIDSHMTYGEVLSFEDFKKYLPESFKEHSDTDKRIKDLYDAYQKIAEHNKKYRAMSSLHEDGVYKVIEEYNEVLNSIKNRSNQRWFVTDSDVDIYYGNYNKGTKLDDEIEQLAKGSLDLKKYFADTIDAFIMGDWGSTKDVARQLIEENENKYRDDTYLADHKAAGDFYSQTKNNELRVNNISTLNPEGNLELSEACRVVRMTDEALEKELEKQTTIIDEVIETYNKFKQVLPYLNAI